MGTSGALVDSPAIPSIQSMTNARRFSQIRQFMDDQDTFRHPYSELQHLGCG